MRLRDAVVKRSLSRIALHHLRSSYFAELNEPALAALREALETPERPGPGQALVARLRRRGMVVDEPGPPFEERAGTSLVSLELEPVGRCNLDCAHCFVGFSGATMAESTFAAILDGAQALGAVELTFNGGEPLLHPRTLDWVAQTTARGFRALLFTNATLVTARVAARLAEAGVAKVTVSLDGFAPEHDAIRGPRAFERATAGIRHLVAQKLPVHVTTMVHPANEAQVASLHRFCRDELGVTGVRVSTIAELGRASGRGELQLDDAQFQAVYAEAAPRNPVVSEGRLPCNAGVDKLFINAGGEVFGCHLFDGTGTALGRLSEEPLAAIYAAVATRQAGALLRRFTPESLVACAGCPALARCGGGCRARALQLTGDPFGVDPVSCRKYGVTPPATVAVGGVRASA